MVRSGSRLLILKYFLSKGDFGTFIFTKLASALKICFVPVSVGNVLWSRHPFKVISSYISEALGCVFSGTKLLYSGLIIPRWGIVKIEPERFVFPCASNFLQS